MNSLNIVNMTKYINVNIKTSFIYIMLRNHGQSVTSAYSHSSMECSILTLQNSIAKYNYFHNLSSVDTVAVWSVCIGNIHILYNAKRGGRGVSNVLYLLYEGRGVVWTGVI